MIPYSYIYLGLASCPNGNFIKKHIYKFKTKFNRIYLFELEEYSHSVFMGKFHLRKHKNLKDKHKVIINDYDGFRILSTCIDIAYREVYMKNNIASFGFIGESRPEEQDERQKVYGDKKRYNTQRFRVYSMISAKHFSPDKFEHISDKENSMYFLLNLENKDLTIDMVNEKVNEYDL